MTMTLIVVYKIMIYDKHSNISVSYNKEQTNLSGKH